MAYYIFHLSIYVWSHFESCSSQMIVRPFDSVNLSVIMPRIIEGRAASLGDVPYQIAFKQRISYLDYVTFCGGIIIRQDKILSAAHCFERKQSPCSITRDDITVPRKYLSRMVAVAGNLHNRVRLSMKLEGQWARILRAAYPATYKFPKNDIAVIITARRFVYSPHVAPIPIAKVFIDYRKQCLVSGYGRISLTSKRKSNKLLLADLELIPDNFCSKLHRRNMHKFICTSSRASDVAEGDSGGPLVCKNTGDPNDEGKGILVGIVSGHAIGVGSFFTRVSSFGDFIARADAAIIYGSYFLIRLKCLVLFYIVHTCSLMLF